MPQTIAVIGASRGIGAGLVTQLQQQPDTTVIATMRKPTASPASNVEVLSMDISSEASVSSAAAEVPELDTLIVNAAIGDNEHLCTTSSERLTDYLATNVVGPHRVVRAFLPALRKRQTKKIIIISSTSGSMEKQIGATSGFLGPYAVTKAADNMLAVQFHNELVGEGFTVVPLHPGWVATDMGNVGGPGAMPIEESAKGIVKVLNGLKKGDSAKFFNWDGSSSPW